MQEAIDKEKNFIVTSVSCPKPETGYIERDGDNVLSFREKPNQVSREIYCQRNFLWNSGMFVLKQVFY
jgi:mannose-1-phosphate guanylyltransferase